MTQLNRHLPLLAGGALLSRTLGLLRDVLIAGLLGPSADAFLAAFRLPNLFRRLLAEGSLGLALTSAATQELHSGGLTALRNWSRAVSIRLAIRGGLTALVLAAAAIPLLSCLAPGLTPEAKTLAAYCLWAALPYLPLCLLAAQLYAQAAAQQRFRAQALASAQFNCVLLAIGGLLLMLSKILPQELPLTDCLTAPVLSFGICLAGLLQVWSGRRAAMDRNSTPAAPIDSRQQQALRYVLRVLPGSFLGAAPHQLHILAGTLLASFAGGGISAVYLAERLTELPLGVFGVSLGLTAATGLSVAAAQTDYEAFTRQVQDSLRLGCFLSLPAAAGLIALSEPLCSLLFLRGAYDGHAVAATAAALQGAACGLPALCASRPLLAAVNALNLSKASAKASLYSLAPVAVFGASALLVTDQAGTDFMRCIGLSLAAGAWCNAALLTRFLTRELRVRSQATPPPPLLLPCLVPCLTYAVTSTAMGLLLRLSCDSWGSLRLLVCIPLAAAAWVLLFRAFGNRDAVALFDILGRCPKPRRGAAPGPRWGT